MRCFFPKVKDFHQVDSQKKHARQPLFHNDQLLPIPHIEDFFFHLFHV